MIYSNELEEQRPGENRDTKIIHSYINGNEFRRKFDRITNNKEINRLLYSLAKKMLEHRNGTLYEDMYWIDLETSEVFAQAVDSPTEQQIIYSKSVQEKINEHKKIITIHSHPSGFPPSVEDFNSNYDRGYILGVVVGHDGSVYMYSSDEPVNSNYYQIIVEDNIKSGYNEREAQKEALKCVSKNFSIKYKEVVN